MSSYLDIDDAASGNPKAIAELATLRAQRDALRDALTRIAAIPLGSLAKNSCAGTIAVNVARAALDGDK